MQFNIEADFNSAPALPAPPARERAAKEVGACAPSEFLHTPAEPIADALVLVASQVLCTCCGHKHINTEFRTFLRKGSKFSLNRADKIFTRGLPREIKLLHFESEYCLSCFAGGASAGDLIQSPSTLTDPVLSSLNSAGASPLAAATLISLGVPDGP
jgi:hypothetical protein